MSAPWAICMAAEDGASLAALRLREGIEAGDAHGRIWIRGRDCDPALDLQLRALPALGRYEWLPADQLRPVGCRIPSGVLPAIRWAPLARWLQVEAPAAGLPANDPEPVPLRLARSTAGPEPDLLLTRFDEWRDFVAGAAQVRLDRLRFAADPVGAVLVRGRPLPPLPGRRFVVHGCVAVPAGYDWRPAVGEDVLARCFRVTGAGLVVWHPDDTISRLHGEDFIPATRSAVRATEAGLAQTR